MKLVTFAYNGASHLGAIRDDRVIDLHLASHGRLPADMLTLLQQGEPAMQLARQMVEQTKTGLPLAEVKLLAPIPNPSKVIAIGLNYMDHCREQKVDPPPRRLSLPSFPPRLSAPVRASDGIRP